MRCTFAVEGKAKAAWAEERDDLPLYEGDAVSHNGTHYEIVEGPRYVADWETATMSATFVVKPAPTSRRLSVVGRSGRQQ